MATWLRLERCLLPPPITVRWNGGDLKVEEYPTWKKVAYCAKNFFTFIALIPALPFTLAYDWLTLKKIAPIQKKIDIGHVPNWPPALRGFACSLFQTGGVGTDASATAALIGKCDWNKWMKKRDHVIRPEGFDDKNFFTDVLSDPTAYIEMLVAHNVTAHRFSLEWSVIEPKRGEVDMKAVELYRNLIAKLLEKGITPSITLSHFVVPEWFYESGNFQKMENIDLYVEFALKAMDLFPEVKDWWSFNELGVKAFQQAREVYPTDVPEGSSLPKRVYAAGVATRNMLIAHCKLHTAVKKLHPDNKVGVTHQWLKFDTARGNWLERLFAYYFTKFAFTPVYQFFEKGRFSFEFPFMANIHFEADGHFLDHLGVQAYPKALLKMGLNHGEKYPGTVKNFGPFTFGSTCKPGGVVMSFGPAWNAAAMDECLDEAFRLTPNVAVTETGSDANVQKWGDAQFSYDNAAQANYLRQLIERIEAYCTRTSRNIRGLFCWSDLRRQMEWDNGQKCRLGIVDPIVDGDRRMVGWKETPASEYLASAYKVEKLAKDLVA